MYKKLCLIGLMLVSTVVLSDTFSNIVMFDGVVPYGVTGGQPARVIRQQQGAGFLLGIVRDSTVPFSTVTDTSTDVKLDKLDAPKYTNVELKIK